MAYNAESPPRLREPQYLICPRVKLCQMIGLTGYYDRISLTLAKKALFPN